MKKIILLFAFALIGFASCQDSTEEVVEQQQSKIDMSDFFVYTEQGTDLLSKSSNSRNCYSMKVLNQKLDENPGLFKKMYDIEYATRKSISAKGKPGGGGGNGGGGTDPVPYTGAITIPVIINILEDNPGDVTQAQINSQIAILNEDFNNNNPNTPNAPAEFSGLVADVNITFTLAGVNRKVSSKSTWGTNDAMKDSGQGGIDATDPSSYLNVWVCNIGGGILGYAQFPGGAAATDGVVIGNDYFGETSGVYGDGRTATHEVGHWLNLRHIWGDGRCRQDDFVADTPSSDRSNGGCPTYPTVHCKSADMTMNYMDYVYDDCMYMFTNGQNDRMRALFTAGGPKASFVGN
ncbi:zinc metalloprotease [Polaribacter gochangensis]|uniref:zinc metalloprotease n=1 Tax=Polaribacter gochangensis TaxID=3252903 RepID=UPI0039048A21